MSAPKLEVGDPQFLQVYAYEVDEVADYVNVSHFSPDLRAVTERQMSTADAHALADWIKANVPEPPKPLKWRIDDLDGDTNLRVNGLLYAYVLSGGGLNVVATADDLKLVPAEQWGEMMTALLRAHREAVDGES